MYLLLKIINVMLYILYTRQQKDHKFMPYYDILPKTIFQFIYKGSFK